MFFSDKDPKKYNDLKKGDIVHLIRAKSYLTKKKPKYYYTGEVLHDRIIDDRFSTENLGWNWSIIRQNPKHIEKKEIRYLINWQEQSYPNDELYDKIMKGRNNGQTIKKLEM